MEHSLAIIIPAYRGRFLSQTLDSLAAQTNTNFKVYVGDDNSTDDIKSIIERYRDKLSIKYQKFSENFGAVNLAAHWKRCIDMSIGEEWIWILPDDDMASPECVHFFFAVEPKDKKVEKLYRFQTVHIDEHDKIIKSTPECPLLESNTDFLIRKLRFERNSSVAEYIFSKKEFRAAGGFTSLPLAWGTDDLLWITLSSKYDIVTLPAGVVYLRQSRFNISNNRGLADEKFDAKYLFFKKLFSDKNFMNKAEREYGSAVLKRTISNHLFFEYRSYGINFLNKNLIRFAQKNNELLGGGILKNIYRLLRYHFKK